MPFSERPVNGPPYPPPTPAPLDRNHPSASPSNANQADSSTPHQITNSGECLDHGILFLPSSPSSEGWSNLAASVKSGFALTGSAVAGQIGPVLGLRDVWESCDSYLFRISLPGVARDERSFSCEVEIDGTVFIKGVTVTGGRRVEKYSQSFEMCSQNLSLWSRTLLHLL